MSTPPTTGNAAPTNPFDAVGPEIPDQSSAVGAFSRAAVRGALPSLGGLGASGFGAEAGGLLGSGFGGVGRLIGSIGGAVVGGFAGSAAIEKAQQWGLSKLPDSWVEALGQDDRQQRIDQTEHPVASFLGGLAPYALSLTPGSAPKVALAENATAFQRIMANPATARVFGGAAMGGMELGQELIGGEHKVDWTKVGIATGFGMIFNRPTKLGESLTEMGAQPVRNTANAYLLSQGLNAAEPAAPTVPIAPEAQVEPGAEPPSLVGRNTVSYPGLTVAQAGDAKVMGPGITEDVFQGTHQQAAPAAMTAQDAVRSEDTALGRAPQPEPDLHAIARRMEPELFQQYDALSAQREEFRNWLSEQSNPPDEQFDNLTSQRTALESQLAEVPTSGAGQNKPLARRLRAQIRDLQTQQDALQARRDAFASGEGEQAPEMSAARDRLMQADFAMRDLGPQVASAYRRAAEASATELPPLDPESAAEVAESGANTSPESQASDADGALPPQESGSSETAAAAPSVPKAASAPSIGADVARQLIAAGRPAEEAEAAGRLIQARYETRAGRFEGSLGTPEELYAREGAAIHGPNGAAPRAAAAPRVTIREAPLPKEQTAASYIVQRGGLARTPELEQILDKNPSIPGAGRLLRNKGGLSLDDALQALKEGGYLVDPGDLGGEARLTDQDVLDLVDKEARGQKVFPLGSERNLPERVTTEAAEHEYAQSDDSVRKAFAEAGYDPKTMDLDATARAVQFIQEGLETDPLTAYERAEDELSRARDYADFAGVQPGDFFQGFQGKIRIAPGRRPIITLAKDANASTFIHETGHQWLEELMRDADHPQAPDVLKDDALAIKDWLGVNDSDEIKTRHHEKFARGFEQYMREGVAPSKGLADVFAKFRGWLLSIYQNLRGLGKPIGDDVRGVFDRLIAMEPERTVVAPERQTGPTLADIHEADAAETEPHEALPAADRIASEAGRFISELPEEVRHELETATGGTGSEPNTGAEPGTEAATGPGERGEVGNGGGGPEPVSTGRMGGASNGQIVESGASAAAESGGVSGRDTGSGPRGASPVEQLAPEPSQLFGPRESPWLDKAGNIRLDNLTSREDVARAIQAAADENDDFIGDRRGRITDGQAMELADDIGLPGAWELVKNRVAGQAFNAEQVLILRRLLRQSATDVADLMRRVAMPESTDQDVLAYALAKDRHQMIQATVSQATAEAGRALRAHRDISRTETNQNLEQFIRSATGKTLFQLRQEAKLGAVLDTPQQVSKFMQDMTKRSAGRMLFEYYVNDLISGPATHLTYLISNQIFSLQKTLLATPVAASIGAIRRAQGFEGETTRFGEVPARLKGMARGLGPAIKAGADALWSGTTTLLPGEKGTMQLPFEGPNTLANPAQLDLDAKWHEVAGSVFSVMRGLRDSIVTSGSLLKAGGEKDAPMFGLSYSPTGQLPDVQYRGATFLPVGSVMRTPSRAVTAIHSFGRAMEYSTEIAGLAYRKAMAEGLTGNSLAERIGELRQSPTQEMMEMGHAAATSATLMDQGGPLMQRLSSLLNWAPELPGLGETPVFRFIDPFVKIAGAIEKRAIMEHTPLGIISGELRADLLGKNGVPAQEMAAAKMAVGSALALTLYGLAAQKLATGSGPIDPAKAAMWRLAGWQPYSVRIGDTWYSYHRLGPLGMLMGVAADMYDVVQTGASEGMAQGAGAFVNAFAHNFLDESWAKGPSELLMAIEHHEQYGGQYVRNFLSSFSPFSVGSSQIAHAIDPYSRQARTIVDAFKRKIPWVSEDLFPRRDVWGEPMPNGDALVSPGVTAIYKQRISDDPVNQAMLQLGIAPAQVKRTIRNVPLTDQQYDDYARMAGRMAKQRLDMIVRSPDWRTWPAHTQHDVIQEVIKQSRESASGALMMKYPTIVEAATAAKLAKVTGNPAKTIH
jgi:hypothetical protein